MEVFTPTLPLERKLGKQIYQALQGPVVETILKTAKDGSGDDYWRSRMEGHCMKVDRDILPDFRAYAPRLQGPCGLLCHGDSIKEISQKFAEMIQRNYVPSLESIC